MDVPFQNLLHFKTEDWNALWGTWHPWHLILGTRMVWVAKRSCCSACCEGSEFEGAKLREGSVLATPFQSPPKMSLPLPAVSMYLQVMIPAFCLYSIYIYIIGFSADDLKKLQHMLIASKYRVILAEIVYVYLFLWTHVEKKNIYNYIYVCVSAVVHMFCLHINTHTHTYHIYLRSNITCKHDT